MAGLTHPSLVVLSGAGLSAESGVATFRGSDGLWEGHRIEDVATPGAFKKQPQIVQRFYNLRRSGLKTVEPNAAHHALVKLERDWPGAFLHITQNVDDLNERAGASKLLHMHGELKKVRCVWCRSVLAWETDLETRTPCPECAKPGKLRPDIVWFGEMPYRMDEIFEALSNCDLFLSIGTSGNVYPAADFVNAALRHGALTAELNLEPSLNASVFHESLTGPASITVPDYVRSVLS